MCVCIFRRAILGARRFYRRSKKAHSDEGCSTRCKVRDLVKHARAHAWLQGCMLLMHEWLKVHRGFLSPARVAMVLFQQRAVALASSTTLSLAQRVGAADLRYPRWYHTLTNVSLVGCHEATWEHGTRDGSDDGATDRSVRRKNEGDRRGALLGKHWSVFGSVGAAPAKCMLIHSPIYSQYIETVPLVYFSISGEKIIVLRVASDTGQTLWTTGVKSCGVSEETVGERMMPTVFRFHATLHERMCTGHC